MTRGTPTPDQPPRRHAPADSQALIEVLEPGLRRHYGRAVQVRRLERRAFEYSTSFALEALDVTLDNGDRLELVFKDLGPASLIEEASAIRPHDFYHPLREIGVYQGILAGRGFGTPVCYAAAADERIGRYWLFLERVPGARLCHVGDFAAWEAAARWLARFHASHADDGASRPISDGVPLLRYDEAFYRAWPARGRRHLAGRVDVAPDARRALDRITDRYDAVIDRLMQLGPTLIHGEFYGSNILVREASARLRSGSICPIDWEMAGIGPGLIDLAALTAGGWTAIQREAMASAYRSAMADAGRPAPPLPQLLDSLNWCRLHSAIQWLGWAAHWQPPPDEAHDWAREAVTVAASLGLL